MMSEVEKVRDPIDLSFWESQGEMAKLAILGGKYWNKVQGWLSWLNYQVDAQESPLTIVKLLAFQRDVQRFQDEPESLFRLRVKHALANAKDAGSSAGFKEIWKRLELGYLGQNERVPGLDWDIVQLEITENALNDNPELLSVIIQKYGRTCRRYTYSTLAPAPITIRTFDFDHVRTDCIAREQENMNVDIVERSVGFGNDVEFILAKEG